jgi:diaminopimelate decarboxylase
LSNGRLALESCDLVELAHARGTPLWVISRKTLEDNFGRLLSVFRQRYPRCEIAYSVKANNTMSVIHILHRCGAKIDASAEHEFQLALHCGIPPSDIILNGNGKSDVALRTAAEIGVREVNVDSLDEVRRLDVLATELGTRIPCMVRVQLRYDRLLDLDPSYERAVRVVEGKFGSSLPTGQAIETIEAVVRSSNLDFQGLHHHVGFSGWWPDYSPDHEVSHHSECAREICELANDIRRRLGVSIKRLNLGGGLRAGGKVLLSTSEGGLAYCDLPTPEDYADAIFGTIEEVLEVSEAPLVQFETGGHLVGNAGLMLATVTEVKDVRAEPPRRYVVIDGSRMMFVLFGMTRVRHPIMLVETPLAAPIMELPVEVVGQTCVYDVVAEDVRLPEVSRGDIVALLNQGAYCDTTSTQLNAFPRPEVVLVQGDRTSVIKRRETLADVYGRDIILPELWARP